MAAHLWATSALLIFHLTCVLQKSFYQDIGNCGKGWFGLHCQYKCRCTDDWCKADGTCTKCEKGWFGPACQYYNLIAEDDTVFSRNIAEITDNDDETCNPENLTMISVMWKQPNPFSWLRLHIKKSESAPSINITLFNGDSPVNCSNASLSEQSHVTYDFHCNLTVAVTEVVIVGDVVSDLCSLYISGGRNVALRQPTNQSSTYVSKPYRVNSTSSRSENAVDGNPSGDFYQHSCTHTNEGNNPFWRTDFRSPNLVNRYVLYNRNMQFERLDGFNLLSYDDNGLEIFEHNSTTTGRQLYTITDPINDHIVKSIVIVLKKSNATLILCELEAYGDSVCKAGLYGRDCQHKCNCFSETESCLVSTGACPLGCSASYYGEGCQSVNNCTAGSYGANCDKSCPERCQGKTCSKESGFCTGCQPGWQGLTCDKACNFGTYGKGCKQLCSFKCRSVGCDPVDGICVDGCDKGYRPPHCFEECDSGYHGYNCTQVCSKNCQNETCEITEGKCHLGCLPGYQDNQCDKECDSTFYGNDCSQKCSSACENSECSHTSGVCKGCPVGKIGDQCDTNCTDGTYGMKCASQCSKNCGGSKSCNIQSGECVDGCEDGFTGPHCQQQCEGKTFGEGCKSNCSQFCAVNLAAEKPSVCHHVSGECLSGCVTEYEGPKCLQYKGSPASSNAGAIAGPIIVAFILVFIVIVSFVVWRKWRRKHKNIFDSNRETDISESGLVESREVITESDAPVEKATANSNGLGFHPPDEKDEVYNNTILEPYKTAIAVKDLNAFMLSHSNEFFVEQFKRIPVSCNAPMTVSQSAENKSKNRYKNICAYDHSRVLLTVDVEKKHGDYINASYIQGYKSKEKFIASQGPNKVILEDFIRLLWEQKTELVVMLTNLVEEGKLKCEKYWPTDDDLVFGEIGIKLLATQMFEEYVIRRLQLTKTGQPPHCLTHFHYTAWPDKGVPATPWSLVDFEQRIASYPTSRPIVVHCSAGVGRTGTFIALYNVIKEAEDIGYMDFYSALWKLRQDRTSMIQTVEQYIFLHKAAQVATVCSGTAVASIDDIVDRINDVKISSDSGLTKIEKEFKDLITICTNGISDTDEDGSNGSTNSTYQNSRTVVNKMKNRFSNVLPKELYRPHLFCESKDMGDYINAVLIPQSYCSQSSRILTQLPLPTTILDFWRLVSQYKVQIIVAFETDVDDSTAGAYLPSEDCPMQCGSFEIETKSKQPDTLWEEKLLSVTKHKRKKSGLSSVTDHVDEHHVTHLRCTKCDLDPDYLLAVVKQVRSYCPRDKVLYMCRNGADYSGLLCILSLLLDRMDSDHQVMVPLVVGSVKTIRPQVIPTLDQYRALYKVLKLYTEYSTTYNNCSDLPTEIGLNKYVVDINDDKNIYANS